MRTILCIIALLMPCSVWLQTMQIGVLRNQKTTKIEIKVVRGSYKVIGDDFTAAELEAGQSIVLETNTKNRVRTTMKGQVLGNFNKVIIRGALRGDILELKSVSPSAKAREYHGDLIVTNPLNDLKLVNHVSIEHYLSGVVECEGGTGHTETYYMVQAIMSRTYALKYLDKHKADGFQLCDQVHCQAYHHRQMRTPLINQAVVQTDGMVMVDEKNRLIDAFFYANCGGETCDASYVWNTSISYLTPFRDTFCIKTAQARWTKKIPKQDWVKFLVNNYDYPIYDSVYREKIFHFVQEHRLAFFHGPELGIPLRDIRQEFKLKSTFFSCYDHEEHVILEGFGYGHGVGLCQEGAMEMARRGYHFTQILRYYFPGIIIRVLEKTDYFQHVEKSPEDF
jgi:stage II sporulation protein D